MLLFAGVHLGTYFSELWQYHVVGTWQQLVFPMAPAARAYHSMVWDADSRSMLVFGGENGAILGDLVRCSLRHQVVCQNRGMNPMNPKGVRLQQVFFQVAEVLKLVCQIIGGGRWFLLGVRAARSYETQNGVSPKKDVAWQRMARVFASLAPSQKPSFPSLNPKP